MMNAKSLKGLVVMAVLLTALAATNTFFGFSGTSNSNRYVLAVSWQPAFCEGARRKPECRSQNENRFDASNFTLHGLWPQPGSNIYCNVQESQIGTDKSGRWRNLPKLTLKQETCKALQRQMPGTQSFLHRHEWVKHGTCYSGNDPERYFADSLRLLAELNSSPVRKLFVGNIRKELTARDVRDAFDKAFGEGAGRRVKISCRRDSGRQLITEITIGLTGAIEPGTPMADLIAASPETDAGCPGGIIDPVGFQ